VERTRALSRALPRDYHQLVAVAANYYSEEGPEENISRSLLAACRAVEAKPNDPDANHLASRSCFWLTDYGATPVCCKAFSRKVVAADCVRFGQSAVLFGKKAPDYLQYLYTYALNLGLDVQNGPAVAAPTKLKRLVKALKRLAREAPETDQGGPLRMLGAIYLKAPAWPLSCGDQDEARTVLEKASEEYPGHPLNHLFLAETLMAFEEYDGARTELETARSLMDPAKYLWRAEQWRKLADKVGKEIERRDSD
jgi:tetratricopeptide (TPR) repeat protein